MKMTGTTTDCDCYIIDSCGWIEYLSDGPLSDNYAEYIEEAQLENFFTPTIVLFEVYKRLRLLYSDEEAMKAVAHIKFCTTIIDLTESIALKAAYMSIEKKIPMADSIILSSSVEYKASIITSDSDFKNIDGVIFFQK